VSKEERSKELFIEDIYDSINAIEEYVKYIDFEEFKNDRKTYQAVIREFEIIGEATKNILSFLNDVYPQYNWREVIDFRNKITHEYFGVNFNIIWNSIFYELPKLKK